MRIEVYVGTLAIEVPAALLKLVILLCGTALLDCIEDVEAMVLVELERLRDFFRARTVLVILFCVVVLERGLVLVTRGVLEQIKVELLVLQDAFIQGLL